MLNRKIWKRCRSGFILGLVLLFGACVTPLPPPGAVSPLKEQNVFKRAPSDADLVQEGITYLGNPGQANDYIKARAAFDSMLKKYPESKWRRLSETLVRLIDDVQSCQEQDLVVSNVRQENERLKKEIRNLDKMQTEAVRLQQENEQLKKDIQLLKELEVQLDRREKMLR